MRVSARKRLQYFLDAGNLVEIGADVGPVDHLKFRDLKKYKDRLHDAQKNSGEKEALIALKGHLQGLSLVACALNINLLAARWEPLSVSVLFGRWIPVLSYGFL